MKNKHHNPQTITIFQ